NGNAPGGDDARSLATADIPLIDGVAPFSRVVFIGAGFSAGMHYPVGGTLISALVDYLCGRQKNKQPIDLGVTKGIEKKTRYRKRAEGIVKVIERVLKIYFSISLEKVGDVDVAEFFTMAHTLAELPLLFGLNKIEEAAYTSEEDESPPSESTLFEDLSAITR